MKKRTQIFYTGHVQGVGFRYTVEAMARAFPVTGYVKNLPDGRVELVVEGSQEAVGDFLQSIEESRLRDFIRSHQMSVSPPQENFSDFRILY